MVLIRDPLSTFEPQALLRTDLEVAPEHILTWCIVRWQLEVTFHEVRTHLGVETQRQWSDLALLRTTPALLGLLSVIILFAHQLLHKHPFLFRKSAWYTKPLPTFADTLALVRQQLWSISLSSRSSAHPDMVAIPRDLLEQLTNALLFAA